MYRRVRWFNEPGSGGLRPIRKLSARASYWSGPESQETLTIGSRRAPVAVGGTAGWRGATGVIRS